jgi:protocatechuate 3,4-dioxygenase beta subunit
VRNDIRSSVGGLSGTAAGVLLNIELTIVSAATCSLLADYAVYLWHCDAAGNYSLYSSGFTNANFLRGVQAADANGKVKFTSIFPGCYAGRWPHIHFEVYQNLTAAQAVSNKIATSQIALPKASCDLVYATANYTSSARNLAGVSLATDGIFSVGASLELATVSGDVTNGMTAALSVGV